MRKNSYLHRLTLGVVSAMILAACSGGDAAAPTAPAPTAPAPAATEGAELSVPDSPADGVTSSAIRIGWMGDVTGPTASSQAFNLRGAQAYFEWANAQGGVLGRTLELVVKDDEFGAEMGISNFTSLLNDERVLALNHVGGSHIIGAFLEDAERADLAIVSVAQTTSEQLDSPVAFHTVAHMFDQSDIAVARMLDSKGGADDLRVGVAHMEVPSGLEWVEGIRMALAAQGGTLVGTIAIPVAAPDSGSFVGSVRRLMEEQGMNYLALHGAPATGLFVVNSLAGEGISIPVGGTNSMANLNIYEAGDPVMTATFEGIHSFVTVADDTPGTAVIRDFIAGAGSRYAAEAQHNNFTMGWVGARIIHEAVLRAAENGSLTRRDFLAALKGKFEMDGLTCDVDWSVTNHSACAAPFTSDGKTMRIVGTFDDWSPQLRRVYVIN